MRDHPGVTAPIIGARTAAQLRESLTVEECELPADDPGPRRRVSPATRRMEACDQCREAAPGIEHRKALRPGVEYEFSKMLISREHSRNVVTRMLVERAEQGGRELDHVRVGADGTRRIVLRRKIIQRCATA